MNRIIIALLLPAACFESQAAIPSLADVTNSVAAYLSNSYVATTNTISYSVTVANEFVFTTNSAATAAAQTNATVAVTNTYNVGGSVDLAVTITNSSPLDVTNLAPKILAGESITTSYGDPYSVLLCQSASCWWSYLLGNIATPTGVSTNYSYSFSPGRGSGFGPVYFKRYRIFNYGRVDVIPRQPDSDAWQLFKGRMDWIAVNNNLGNY